MTPKERAAIQQLGLGDLAAEFLEDGIFERTDAALREVLDHSGEANEMVIGWDRVKPEAIASDPLYQQGFVDGVEEGRNQIAEQADGEQWSPDDMAYRPSGLSMEQAEREPFDMDDHPPHRLCECLKCMEYFTPLPDCDAFAGGGKPIVEQTNTQLMEGYRIGLAEMREKCAKVCDEYAADPDDDHNLSALCAKAIRAINFEGDTGFRPVSEMIAEHKQDPKKGAAIEKAKMRKAEQKPVASIYISLYGDREFDDWGVDLPAGRNILYAAPVQQLEQEPVAEVVLRSQFETWWEREGQEFLYALNTTTDDDIKLVAEFAWKYAFAAPGKVIAEQEPVAWMHTFAGDVQINNLPAECYGDHWTRTPLYAAPVRTKDLTDDEISRVWMLNGGGLAANCYHEFTRAVIAADRKLNGVEK